MNHSKGFTLLEVMLACTLFTSVLLLALLVLKQQGVRIDRWQQQWLKQQTEINQREQR